MGGLPILGDSEFVGIRSRTELVPNRGTGPAGASAARPVPDVCVLAATCARLPGRHARPVRAGHRGRG